MLEYTLKVAALQDLDAVYAFEAAVLPDAWSRQTLQTVLQSKLQQILLLFAQTEEENALPVALLHWQSSYDFIDIFNIGVREEYRRRGLASLLLNLPAAILQHKLTAYLAAARCEIEPETLRYLENKFAAEVNWQYINLEVRSSNKSACNCYQRNGFVQIRKIAGFYRQAPFNRSTNWDYQGEAAYCLQKVLRH